MSRENKNIKWDASDYAKNSAVQQTWGKELILKLKLNGKEDVLDIGCGDGKITAEIAQSLKNGTVVGLDSSEEMLTLAKQNFPPTSYPNLSFIRQDVRNLNFNEKFDIIFSNAALHWVIDHKPVLSGIYKALKKEGKVVVQMGGKGNAEQVIKTMNQILKESKWGKYFKDFSFPYGFYAPEEYSLWIEDSGLKLVKITLTPRDMIYKNKDAFKGWIRTTWLHYISKIPIKKQNQFIDHLVETHLNLNPPNKNGEICIKMKRLEFIAKKI